MPEIPAAGHCEAATAPWRGDQACMRPQDRKHGPRSPKERRFEGRCLRGVASQHVPMQLTGTGTERTRTWSAKARRSPDILVFLCLEEVCDEETSWKVGAGGDELTYGAGVAKIS